MADVVRCASGDRDERAGRGVVLARADAQNSLALDDVDDLITAVLFLGPTVGAGRDRHHRDLAARRLLQHAEERAAVWRQRRDLCVLASLHRPSTPFWTRTTPSQASWAPTNTASAGSRP